MVDSAMSVVVVTVMLWASRQGRCRTVTSLQNSAQQRSYQHPTAFISPVNDHVENVLSTSLQQNNFFVASNSKPLRRCSLLSATSKGERSENDITNSGFYDLDNEYENFIGNDYDDYNEGYDDNSPLRTNGQLLTDIDYIDDDNTYTMERDNTDILEEREDRLYVDQFGIKRKIETCVLVGVEDLSISLRKKRAPYTGNINDISYNIGNMMSNDRYTFMDVDDGIDEPFTLEESMTEMRELIKTAGLQLVGEITQRLHQVNPRTYVGTGKVEEANQLLQQHDCCTIVFDAELTPGQQKHLENGLVKY